MLINRTNFIYLCIYGVWLFIMQMMSTTYSELLVDTVTYYKIFTIIFFILLVVSFFFIFRINKNHFYIDLFLTFFLFIVILSSQTFGILAIYTLLLLLSKYTPFEKILKMYVSIFSVVLLIIFLGWVIDVLPPIDVLNESFREDGKYRYSLGFTYTTFLPKYFFHALLAWLVIRKNKLSNLEIILFLGINYIIYDLTNTRAVYYLVNALFFTILFIKFFKIDFYNYRIISTILRFCMKYCLLILCILSIYLHCWYNPNIEWMYNLNIALADRLNLGYKGFIDYGITLFGSDVEYVSYNQVTEFSPYFFLDSSYQRILINFGIFSVLMLLWVGFKLSNLIIVKNNIYLGVSLIFLFGHSFTDPQLLDPIFNPFALIFAYTYSQVGKNNF